MLDNIMRTVGSLDRSKTWTKQQRDYFQELLGAYSHEIQRILDLFEDYSKKLSKIR